MSSLERHCGHLSSRRESLGRLPSRKKLCSEVTSPSALVILRSPPAHWDLRKSRIWPPDRPPLLIIESNLTWSASKSQESHFSLHFIFLITIPSFPNLSIFTSRPALRAECKQYYGAADSQSAGLAWWRFSDCHPQSGTEPPRNAFIQTTIFYRVTTSRGVSRFSNISCHPVAEHEWLSLLLSEQEGHLRIDKIQFNPLHH